MSLILLVFGGAVLFLTTSYNDYSLLSKNYPQETIDLSMMAARTLDLTINEKLENSLLIANFPNVRDVFNDYSENNEVSINESLKRDLFTALEFYDGLDIALISTEMEILFQANDLSYESFLNEKLGMIKSQKDSKIYHFHYGNGESMFILIAPSFRDSFEGEIIGFVLMELSKESLEEVISRKISDEVTEIYVLDYHEDSITKILSSKGENLDFMNVNDLVARQCFDIENGNTNKETLKSMKSLNREGHNVLSAHKYIPSISWCVIVETEFDYKILGLTSSESKFLFYILSSFFILGFLVSLIVGGVYSLKKND
ncbi:MAG: hypothetical protein PF542_02050 [Nanoarchaeota archaeon]|nr:hypothetical protein [Nanoarchaeota archaeon]